MSTMLAGSAMSFEPWVAIEYYTIGGYSIECYVP